MVAQSHPTLCNAIDCSPRDFSVRGVLQARVLEGVALYCCPPSKADFMWDTWWVRQSQRRNHGAALFPRES